MESVSAGPRPAVRAAGLVLGSALAVVGTALGAALLLAGGDPPERGVALVPRVPERWSVPGGFPAADLGALPGDLTGLTAAFAAAAAVSVPQALPGRISLGVPLPPPGPEPSGPPPSPAGLAEISTSPPVFQMNWIGLIRHWF